MCEVTFLKQGESEKVRSYVERTEKLESRFRVVLRKSGDEVEPTMVGIVAMLTKNFIGGLKPQIRSKKTMILAWWLEKHHHLLWLEWQLLLLLLRQ
ncbi:hypothetical protein Mapa_002695 [Marchantia paleacea]|nr:hypothetical protein Mapa_002695 [Marchantia paleacea]